MTQNPLILFSVLLAITPCLGGDFTNRFPSMVTLDGHSYSNVRPQRIEGDQLTLLHSRGIATINVTNLPDNVCHAIGVPAPTERLKSRSEFEASQRAKGLVPYQERYIVHTKDDQDIDIRRREVWLTPEEKAKREEHDREVTKRVTEKGAIEANVTEKEMPKIYQLAKGGGISLTVNSADTADSLGEYTKAKRGYRFIILEVEITNWRKSESPYNPMYFSVKDSDGYEYSTELYAESKALKSGTLSAGEKVVGHIAFQVPQEAKDMVLKYEPIVLLGGYEPLRVLLKK